MRVIEEAIPRATCEHFQSCGEEEATNRPVTKIGCDVRSGKCLSENIQPPLGRALRLFLGVERLADQGEILGVLQRYANSVSTPQRDFLFFDGVRHLYRRGVDTQHRRFAEYKPNPKAVDGVFSRSGNLVLTPGNLVLTPGNLVLTPLGPASELEKLFGTPHRQTPFALLPIWPTTQTPAIDPKLAQVRMDGPQQADLDRRSQE